MFAPYTPLELRARQARVARDAKPLEHRKQGPRALRGPADPLLEQIELVAEVLDLGQRILEVLGDGQPELRADIVVIVGDEAAGANPDRRVHVSTPPSRWASLKRGKVRYPAGVRLLVLRLATCELSLASHRLCR